MTNYETRKCIICGKENTDIPPTCSKECSEIYFIQEKIRILEERREMAAFQRKITTCLGTRIEYDQEIDSIDRRLEQLRYKLK